MRWLELSPDIQERKMEWEKSELCLVWAAGSGQCLVTSYDVK
jgi:hypothetical protein